MFTVLIRHSECKVKRLWRMRNRYPDRFRINYLFFKVAATYIVLIGRSKSRLDTTKIIISYIHRFEACLRGFWKFETILTNNLNFTGNLN
jgi:hypothetical protein